MKYYLHALKNYAEFGGRTSRKEYWMFELWAFIFTVVFALLVSLSQVFSVLFALYLLAMIIPRIAITVRRLHDTDRNGAWYFIIMVPFGSIVLLVFLCQDSDSDNFYGPKPKATVTAY